jgi:hypothetical protein
MRKRLTYANVMSSLAVFLVLGGATAFAATKIGSNEIKANAITTGKIKKEAVTEGKIKAGGVGNSRLGNGSVTGNKLAANAVGTAALADGAVTSPKLGDGAVSNQKLANNAVTEGKIANDAVTGAKVKDGSLTGSDINQGTLNSVKAANVFGVTFAETGTGSPKILNASDPGIKSGGCFIVCVVEFPRDVSECSYTASSTFTTGGSGIPAYAETFPSSVDPASVLVVMWNKEGNLTAHDFAMTVVCPTTS